MPAIDAHATGRLLQEFLRNPKSRFYPFFQNCTQLAYCRLLTLRAGGWRLPTDNHEISNLACEVIEPVFLSRSGRLEQNIVEYLAQSRARDFETIPPDELERLFLPFFYQKCKEGLSKAQRRLHPELYRMRKNFDHILSPPEYPAVTCMIDGVTHFTLADKLRPDRTPVPLEFMTRLAMESLLATTKDTDLCRDFFARLHTFEDIQNFTRRRQLVSCLVHTREMFLREQLTGPAELPTPETDLRRSEIDAARIESIRRVKQWIEDNWNRPGTMNSELVDVMFQGSVLYLDDYCDGCGTDLKAAYFREVASAELQANYNRLYKYNFLKLIGLAERYFEDSLTLGPRQTGKSGAKGY